jgi:hypothetical protein
VAKLNRFACGCGLRTMPLVYQITSPSGKIYVGSTVKPLNERRSDHRNDFKRWNNGRAKSYTTACILFEEGFDACAWSILEECDESVLREREWHYIQTRTCVNKHRPGFTIRGVRAGSGVADSVGLSSLVE